MSAQRGLKDKKLAVKTEKQTTVAIDKVTVEAKKPLTRAKGKENVGAKSKETLPDAQKTLRTVQMLVNREHQARIKVETALNEAQEALVAAQLNVKQERRTRIRRVSFVVRLTVDEHGQFGWTEIEHVESHQKQKFLSPDGERLVAFMKTCISPAIFSEHTILAVPSPKKIGVPTPGPPRPKTSLIVSNVQVFHRGEPDFMTLTLRPEEPLTVQARFQLLGTEARSLTAQEHPYEMKIYAKEVTSGNGMLLTTYQAGLTQNVLDYICLAEVPGLPLGLYRLFTVVTLGAPAKVVGFYGKTIIHVI